MSWHFALTQTALSNESAKRAERCLRTMIRGVWILRDRSRQRTVKTLTYHPFVLLYHANNELRDFV